MPDEVAVISIQGIVGNITIYVPYEVDVQISHSAVTGRLKIFIMRFRKFLMNPLRIKPKTLISHCIKLKYLPRLFQEMSR